MNILFLTLYHIDSLHSRGIYEDLLREFVNHNHNVYVISPIERRYNSDTTLHTEGNAHILELKTGNIQKTNIIEKGISTLLIEHQFIAAIKKYFSHITFDLVLYSTPPITLAGVVEFIKKRDNAKTFLLLKDIFPQNAVDIGLMSKTGFKGLLYKYFRNKEKRLYSVSDRIGCMSPANVDYLLKNTPDIDPAKVSVCPNSIEPVNMSLSEDERVKMRMKYNLPLDKTVFVYGGNLGKPQGISFFIDCLKSQEQNNNVFFLIVGDGTEYSKLQEYVQSNSPSNVKLMNRLPKNDYDYMIASCDVGMIFLDHRFTIPNFPSRLLSYMQAELPVLACTDPNTDIGKIITDAGIGWWCESNDVQAFSRIVAEISNLQDNLIKASPLDYLRNNYSVQQAYEIITRM
ncbi:MAG: glycosyltransferase family 4 protein [Bacteroidales bacterium]|nr:glycosyltransferase family 4 protein [Bacteroidales bacterium]